MKRFLAAGAVALGLGLGLAACNDGAHRSTQPIPTQTLALMSSKGMSQSDPILVRVYKKESELEVWKRVNGQYAHLKTYPICRWSGQLGPKVKEGDRQAPEGFYTINPGQMNPNSSFYLSFDTGYPNAFDRAHGRTGKYLMVHGDCSSSGCYAMTDEGIAEVYAIAREAIVGGQRGFQFQAYPFRMTAENMARYRNDPNMAFWRNLKQGSDHFELTKREPKVSVCAGRYAFNQVGDGCTDDPTLSPAVAQKQGEDNAKIAELVAGGTPSVRVQYSDGGGNEGFRTGAFRAPSSVSRPEALAEGPREIAMETKAAAKPKASLATLTRTGVEKTPAKPGRTQVAHADDGEPLAYRSDKAAKPKADAKKQGQ
jgi:murein L,D-transpeptidase YafK